METATWLSPLMHAINPPQYEPDDRYQKMNRTWVSVDGSITALPEFDGTVKDTAAIAHVESLRRASLAYTSGKCRRAVVAHQLKATPPLTHEDRWRIAKERAETIEKARARSEAAKRGAKKRSELYNLPASVTFDGVCREAKTLRGAFRVASVPLVYMQIYHTVFTNSGCASITYCGKVYEFRILLEIA